MTPRAWSFIVVLAFALALAHTACAATGEIALPTWPQVFNLAPNQVHGFAFPMSAAGRIGVDLTWTGFPLTVTLTDSAGSALKPGTHVEGGTAKLTFTLTAAQVKANPVCMIMLKADNKPMAPPDPKRPPPPAASGKITVTYPPVDMVTFRVKLQPLLTQRATILAKPRLKYDPNALRLLVQSRADAFNKSQLDALNTQQLTLVAKAKLAMSAAATALASSTAGLPTLRLAHTGTPLLAAATLRPKRLGTLAATGLKLASGKTLKPLAGVVTHYDKPTLVSTDPAQGSPGAEVVLVAGGIADDPATLKVLFTVQSTLPAQEAKIISTSISGPETYLVVSVPNPTAPDPTHPLRDYAGTVVVQGPSGATNTLPFHFNPILLPQITNVRRAGIMATPGDTLLVDGVNLVTGTKPFFVFPWDPQHEAPASLASSPAPTANLLPVQIPTYTADRRRTVRFFVRYHYATTYLSFDVDSNEVDVILDKPSPEITLVEAENACIGSSVVVHGDGFSDKGGAVVFVGPRGEANGDVVSWGNTWIVVTVPEACAVAANTPGQVYVRTAGGKQSPPANITLKPLDFEQALDLGACLDDWNVLFGKNSDMDSWGRTASGTIHGEHWNRFWHYDSGTDLYFWATDWPFSLPPGVVLNPKLKRLLNGWKIEKIDFTPDTVSLLSSASLDISHLNSDDPCIGVGWHTPIFIQDGMVQARYDVVITIKGPKGMPYH